MTGSSIADQAAVPVTAATFRQAMSEVTAAVHVVTTLADGVPSGLTASAVTSLSDQPALMLACIREDSRTLADIRRAGLFCINTLADSDRLLAETFAGRKDADGRERFDVGSWGALVTGAPVLASALCVFDCMVFDIRSVATHAIVIGEVRALSGSCSGQGLIYRNRRFGAF